MPGSTYPAQNTATYFISQMEFADAINPEQMEEWNQALAPEGESPEEEGEKKPIGILELLSCRLGASVRTTATSAFTLQLPAFMTPIRIRANCLTL